MPNTAHSKRVLLYAALGLALALAPAFRPAQGNEERGRESLAGPIPARLIKVIDGDTIMVRARIWLGQEVETAVRLLDVDAPELHARCEGERKLAEAARDFVIAFLAEPSLTLRDVARDKYGGRVLAHVSAADGRDLSAALLAARMARPYEGSGRMAWCG